MLAHEVAHSSSGKGPRLRSAGLPSAKWLPLPQISRIFSLLAGQTWVREGLLEMTKDTRLCVCLAMFVMSGKRRLPESQPSEWETDLNKQVIRTGVARVGDRHCYTAMRSTVATSTSG